MRSVSLLSVCVACLLVPVSASAQEPREQPSALLDVHRLGPDLTAAGSLRGMGGTEVPNFLGQVFPPELVMRFQTEIGLSSQQREAISQAMTESYAQVVEAQWEIQAATERLKLLLAGARVDESAALAQIDRVMALEQRLKRSHFALLIRVKNELDAEQQARLRELGPSPRAYFAAPGRPMPPPQRR
ncbi:MAG: periplasmic heavy metal sensor [Myxococcota bacterium]